MVRLLLRGCQKAVMIFQLVDGLSFPMYHIMIKSSNSALFGKCNSVTSHPISSTNCLTEEEEEEEGEGEEEDEQNDNR